MYDTAINPTVPPSGNRDPRRRLVVALLILTVLAGVATGWWFNSPEAGTDGQLRPAPAADNPAPTPEPLVEVPEGGAPTGQPMQGGKQTAFGDGGGASGSTPSEPAPAEPADPCPGLSGEAAEKLVAKPDPVQLKGGATKGSFVLFNCGAALVTWSASSKPYVSFPEDDGAIEPGHDYRVHFNVDTSGLSAGGYTFKIKVTQPGHSQYLDVHGTKLGGLAAAPSPTPSIGGLGAGKPGGCAAQCITKAWLTPLPHKSDMALEVKTHTSARIVVKAGTKAPVEDAHGHPVLPNPAVTTSSGGAYQKLWNTTLSPLTGGTKYHIVLAATDAKGGKSYQVGTFTAPKVATGLSAGKPGGCSANCVKQATLTTKPGTPDLAVDVTAHVPVAMWLYASTEAPREDASGNPFFPQVKPIADTAGTYKKEWSTKATLKYGTTYHVILKVVDGQGHKQFHTAKLTTPPEPKADHGTVRVTFHKIRVTDDADNTFFNRRGELEFVFEVNGQYRPELATGVHKVKAPDWVGLDDGDQEPGRGVVIENAPDQIAIKVQGIEHDGRKRDICQATPEGWTPFSRPTSGRAQSCDELEWNTASGVISLDVAPGALPPCFGYPKGVNGDGCYQINATGDDPRFEVYLTVDFVD